MGVTIVDTQDTAKIKKNGKIFILQEIVPSGTSCAGSATSGRCLVLITLNVNGTMRFSDIRKKQFPTSPNVC